VAEVDPNFSGNLLGDPVRLRQVLLNLLSNAIKFTSAGEVSVQACVVHATPAAARIQFSVRDTGIGIARDIAARLFEPFTQADASINRRFGGTGLGLAICKRLVEMMGGVITIDSRLAQGSTFWFEIDLPRVAETGESAGARVLASSLNGVRALLVDDNATNRKFLDHLLKAWGMDLHQASTGAEALRVLGEAAADRPFHLVLLDSHMPEMDGYTLAREIRRMPALAAVRLVLLTAHSERPLRSELQERGIAACLVKPLRKKALHECLLEVMGPASAATPAVPGMPATLSPEFSPARILVAEDNVVNQKVALLHLQRLGYKADVVADGRAAVAAVQQQPYDLVFMDCQMPEIDGYAATRQIRAREKQAGAARLAIVAMTAGALAGDREACLSAGMDDYISKPVRQDELRQILQRHLPAHLRAVA
jgi:CheY-like chemotaxis protein